MSRVLEIEETEDDQKIIGAFVDQYSRLGLPQAEKNAELWDRLKERLMAIAREEQSANAESGAGWEMTESGIQQMKLF